MAWERVSDYPTVDMAKIDRHPNSARFHEILEELGALHDRKQKDYGSATDPFANVRATSEWGVPAYVGALIRLNDKVQRLKSMRQKGYLANEAAEDSMRDIAVYAVIALVLYEEEGAIARSSGMPDVDGCHPEPIGKTDPNAPYKPVDFSTDHGLD